MDTEIRMGRAWCYSAAVMGIGARLVEVEVSVRPGGPKVIIVGLPDQAVRESRDRVRTAIEASGFSFPVERKVLVNLAPASRRKIGPVYDLPIALGILAATGHLPAAAMHRIVVLGELALDGRVRPVRGALPVALRVRRGRRSTLLLPTRNAPEAALCPDLTVLPIDTLSQAVAHLAGRGAIRPVVTDPGPLLAPANDGFRPDLADVRGQRTARRALEVAAAGGHNLLLLGPPGAGKTMLARRLPTILPPLTLPEALEATAVHSVAGELGDKPLVSARPFRAPHHSISTAGLVGGGPSPRPGEVSLAHRGVLFLDELPEFDRRALESLRQPLEEGSVRISRVAYSVKYPARFTLVAAMNPCRCGNHGVPGADCACTPPMVAAYRGRISGPLLDRIDLKVELGRVGWADLSAKKPGESSATVRQRILAARERQSRRFPGAPSRTNATMDGREVRTLCPLDPEALGMLAEAVTNLGVSARAHDRILRVARTIADLDGSDDIGPGHLAEAVQYRLGDDVGQVPRSE